MSKLLKIKLPKDLSEQLVYEAYLVGLSTNDYAIHLITQALVTPLQQKNEVNESLKQLNVLLDESKELLHVLLELSTENQHD